MARILYNDEWYEEVSTTALYEGDFERLVLGQIGQLYPNYVAVDFKIVVSSDFGTAKADFALVHKTYRDWWVVEVEMSHHPFNEHVLPQVRALANGNYGLLHAEYLARNCRALNIMRLKDMMKGTQPRVLVIVNKPKVEWVVPLGQLSSLIAVCEIFRSRLNRYMFRINGEHPPQEVNAESTCRFDKQLPRLLTVESPGILQIETGERLVTQYKGDVMEWSRVESGDRVWLNPVGNCVLDRKRSYRLLRTEDGEFELEEVDNT